MGQCTVNDTLAHEDWLDTHASSTESKMWMRALNACSVHPTGSPLRRRERSNRCLAGAVGPMNGFQTPDGKRSKAGEPGSTARDGLEWEFLVGTAISVYQNSGGDNNNWWRYERQRTRFGKPTIDVSGPSRGVAALWQLSTLISMLFYF